MKSQMTDLAFVLKCRFFAANGFCAAKAFLLEQTRQTQRANTLASPLKHLAAVEVIQSVHCTINSLSPNSTCTKSARASSRPLLV